MPALLRSLLTLFSLSLPTAAQQPPAYVTPRDQILSSPAAPSSLPLIGVTHVGGRYHLTGKPFLIEGAEKIRSMGYPGLKLWLTKPATAYPFHSDWSALGENPSLLEMIRHPYYRQALSLPFKAVALEVQEVRTGKGVPGHSINPDSDFAEDEAQIHELSVHLLTDFKDRDIVFILQNWEGDWMFRGGERQAWEKGTYPDLDKRTAAFTRWFAARQRGVDRARSAVPDSKARVLHAIEVNRVLDTWKDIPTLTSRVLPNIRTDLVSWSCYDGFRSWKKSADETAVGIQQGIETIRHFAKRPDDGSPVPVMLGEIGVPERTAAFDASSVAAVFDGALAASSRLRVPYLFIWELYCNEISEGQPPGLPSYREDQLNGFWLLKPDGSPGHTARYFERHLAR